MSFMKLSVSLTDDDIAALDAYVEHAGLPSRSAGVQRAIRLLRHPALEGDYRNAWAEWAYSDEEQLWVSSVAGGVIDAAR
jgi:metal-responsive CopG/Arc/MetJ family transcriptional regulator